MQHKGGKGHILAAELLNGEDFAGKGRVFNHCVLKVPAIMLIAASMLAAFRSGILVSAILRTSSLLMVATLVLLGTPEPDSMLQAFLMSTAAGGVLVMKVKERSAYLRRGQCQADRFAVTQFP